MGEKALLVTLDHTDNYTCLELEQRTPPEMNGAGPYKHVIAKPSASEKRPGYAQPRDKYAAMYHDTLVASAEVRTSSVDPRFLHAYLESRIEEEEPSLLRTELSCNVVDKREGCIHD